MARHPFSDSPEDIEGRFKLMDEAGVEKQVLSPNHPPYLPDEAECVKAVQMLNNSYAELAHRWVPTPSWQQKATRADAIARGSVPPRVVWDPGMRIRLLQGNRESEDKILQGATVMVLNAIYEGDFVGFSCPSASTRGSWQTGARATMYRLGALTMGALIAVADA